MSSYVVMERDNALSDGRAQFTFIRDGFHWLAFLLPVFWLLWNRLWIEAVFAFAAMVLATFAGELIGVPAYASVLGLLVMLYFGLEGAGIRVRALTRRGWQERAVVHASGISDAEISYFASCEDEEDGTVASSPPQAVAMQPAMRSPDAAATGSIGLVPYPGKL